MKPILILSDSLALPRAEPEEVLATETYAALLAAPSRSIISCAYGASSSKNVLWQANYFRNTRLECFVVLQFGIVDCTPRVLNRYEALLLRTLHIRLPSFIARLLRRIRVVRKVSPKHFRRNCETIREMDLGELMVIPIAPASDGFEKEAPGVQSSVELYNKILGEVFGSAICDPEYDVDVDVMSDYHHLTVAGHRKIFEILDIRLRSFV